MPLIKGIAASPGFARGRARVYRPFGLDETKTIAISPSKVASEEARLHDAVIKSVEELERTKERVLNDLNKSEAEIIDAHLTLLQDASFMDRIKQRVVKDLVNVEKALATEVNHLEKILSQMESEYMRERSADFRDIGTRVMRKLVGDNGPHPLSRLPEASILIASELLPLDTLALDRAHVEAIVTERGGSTSHTAILARALGIPLVTGIAHLLEQIEDGDRLLVNGDKGIITINPTPKQSDRYDSRARRYARRRSRAIAAAEPGGACHTADGVEVRLFANINDVDETARVEEFAMGGVGLFRTEFIYMQTDSCPSLATHERYYRTVAQRLGELPCTLRSFDMGDDKLPNFMLNDPNRQRHVGQRGLRFALSHRSLFRTQLRAVARAFKNAPGLRLMFPMVLGGAGLREAIALFERECEREGLTARPQVGAMIETPAAIFDIESILDSADFLSIGTNDLTQYMLAVSRAYADQVGFDATRHPAVLRAMRTVCQAADARGVPVSICGEAAGVPELASIFVGLGFRQLSMSPVRAPEVRAEISRYTLADMQDLASSALHA